MKHFNETHGESYTVLYAKYAKIKSRCNQKDGYKYEIYGKRGITMCKEWKESYIAFRDWSIQNGYHADLTLDRINNDGNYEPDNCRWTTKAVQARNTRRIRASNTSGYRGVRFRKDSKRWRVSIGVNNVRIDLGHFDHPWTGAYTYDAYVLKHKLEHTMNFT